MGKKSREKRERRERGEIRQRKEIPETSFVSLCKKTILIGTLLILFTPLIVDGNFFFPFVGPKSIYFMGLVLIIFTAYLLLASLEPKYRPKLNILLIAVGLFMAVATISSFLGENFFYSFWSKYERMTGLLMMFHLFAFFIVLSSVFKKKQEWFRIFGVSVFVALLMSAIHLFLKVDINLIGDLGPISASGATIGNSSFMGTYLLFNIFLALYLFLKTKKGFRIYSAISLIILFSALWVSGARAALISLFGGLALLFFFWLIFYQKRKFLKLAGASLLSVFTIGTGYMAYLMFQPGSFVYEKIMEMGFGGRFIVWQGAWQGFLERPWFGWGLENFEFVFARHFNFLLFLLQHERLIWFDRAHNIIVDTLVTTGIIGLLAYIAIFVAVFYILVTRALARGEDEVLTSSPKKYFITKEFWTAAIFSVLLIVYFVQNLTVFDMVSSFMMFFLVLGFVGSLASKDGKKVIVSNINHQQRNLNPFIAIIVLAFFGFSFFHFVVQPFRAGHSVIETLRAQPGSSERIALYKKTLAISPLGREQIRVFFADAAVNFFKTEAAQQMKPEEHQLKFDFLSRELEKNIKASPFDLRSHLVLGNLYIAYAGIDPEKINLEKFVRAEEILKQAIGVSPINPQVYWLLVQVKLNQGDFEAALSLAEQAVELEPRIYQSHSVLIQVAIIKGDIEFAREKIDEAIKINPAWEPTLEEFLKH